MFELFDPAGELTIRSGKLPHWYQPGVTYFVTFRTEDSVPQSLMRSWHKRRDAWLRRHGIDPTPAAWKARLRELPELERQFHAVFTREYLDYLDCGHGRCELRVPQLAKHVASALQHFDGQRYHLGDFVVMPNHVHVLVCLLGDTEVETLCKSWKRFAARQINLTLNRGGRFWQEESFDHLVRSAAQFEYLQHYIAQNSIKAGLAPDEFLLHSSLARPNK